jgi:hybrid cluster-associated redox disulfide protein
MDRYTKGFVVASLIYLVLASVLGIWMGTGDAPGWAPFAHIHFNLLGFMAMMIYGVGYFILPRFNSRELRWPSWVPVHFFVANIGLVGMVATYPGIPSTGFGLFAGLSALSVVLFAVNLIATMLAPAEEEDEEEGAVEPATPPLPEIEPDMRVGEILTRWPQVVEVFVANGFPSLGDPAHQEQVKQMPITLRMACQRHEVEVDEMVEKLQAGAVVGGGSVTHMPVKPRPDEGDKGVTSGQRIGPTQVLGEILQAHPATEKVFRKYYGSGCFSCPGQATETVKQSAMMHNVNMRELLDELNRAAGF